MFTELAGGTLLLLLPVVTITDLFAHSEALQNRLKAIADHLEKIEKHIANMNDKVSVGGRIPATPGGR